MSVGGLPYVEDARRIFKNQGSGIFQGVKKDLESFIIIKSRVSVRGKIVYYYILYIIIWQLYTLVCLDI